MAYNGDENDVSIRNVRNSCVVIASHELRISVNSTKLSASHCGNIVMVNRYVSLLLLMNMAR